MKNFSFVCLTTAIMMFYTIESRQHLLPKERVYVPKIVHHLKLDIQREFKKTEYANLLMAFFTGEKLGIGVRSKGDLKKVNLIFLLSPSGLHLGVMFLFLQTLLRPMIGQRLKKVLAPLLLVILGLHGHIFSYQSFIRSLYLRSLIRIKFICKFKLTIEMMIILAFIISFCFGHYHKSPLSFVMSFAFIGTFICLRDHSKLHLILGLFLIQVIINLFLAQKISLISIALGLLGVFVFKYLYMLIMFYLLSFYLYPSNWIEPLIKLYMQSVRFLAVELRGTFTSSSLFLILGLSALLFIERFSRWRSLLIAVCFFLHTNTAKAPAITFLL